MYDVDRVLEELARRTKGLVVRRRALAAGVSEDDLDHRIAAGRLERLHEGVYRHAAAVFTQDMRWLAAVLACGDDAALSHRAAAALHGFPGVRRVRPEVTTPHTDLPLLRGVDVHRAVRLQPFERTIVRGIPVTAKGKTAIDYCGRTPFHIAQEVIAEAVITKVLTPITIVAAIERSGGRGIWGTARLREIALTLDEILELESVLELHGARLVELANVPAPVRQHEMVCADGRRVRFDLAWPLLRYGLDWDGKRWHGTPARKKRTRERHESIVGTGWAHDQFGWSDVHDTPLDVRRQVELTYALRAGDAGRAA
jgi:hypothetical protein